MPQRLSTTLTQKDSRGDAAFLTSPETPLPIRKVSVATRQAFKLSWFTPQRFDFKSGFTTQTRLSGVSGFSGFRGFSRFSGLSGLNGFRVRYAKV